MEARIVAAGAGVAAAGVGLLVVPVLLGVLLAVPAAPVGAGVKLLDTADEDEPLLPPPPPPPPQPLNAAVKTRSPAEASPKRARTGRRNGEVEPEFTKETFQQYGAG